MELQRALARISLQKPGITLKFFLCKLPMLCIKLLEDLTVGLCNMSGKAPNHLSFSFCPGKLLKKAPHLN